MSSVPATLDPPTSDPSPSAQDNVVDPAPRVAGRGRLDRFWRGPEEDPAWARPALLTILGLTTLLYVWNLSANGMANEFYAAAVKSGTVSWKAFLFGSIDPGNAITVDKPPMALWVMDLSGRIFGFSSWSMLLPEALMGVASVGLLWHLVKRWMGPVAAVIASVALATTPIAVLMFRFNNPDALLTLLMLLGIWGVAVAIERDRALPLVLAGVAIGAAVLTKLLAGVLVVPALGLVYLVCAHATLPRRIARLLMAGAAFLVSAGWFFVLIELWPAGSRPYIGGSTDNSLFQLMFGYNGLSRVTGTSGGGPGGGVGVNFGGVNFGGATGWGRMFNSLIGGQVAWLVPIAGIGLVAGLWLAGRAVRTDPVRTGFLLWGGVTASLFVIFSFSAGIFHPYYVVALAPGVAALTGGGVVALWRLGDRSVWHAWLLPLAIAITGWWAYALLARSPGFAPALRVLVLWGSLLAAFAIGLLRTWQPGRSAAVVAAGVGVVALLAGPTAYSLHTVAHASTGSTPSAGPAVAGGTGGFGGGPGGLGRGGFGGGTGPADGAPPGFGPGAQTGGGTFTPPAGGGTGATGAGGFGGGPGGGGASADSTLVHYLEAHQGHAKFLVATFGSMSSAPIIIATGKPVVTIGGFGGGDPYPSLAQFEQLVSSGQLRYVVLGGGLGGLGGRLGGGLGGQGGPGGGGSSAAITAWVQAHGTAVDYGGSATLFKLTA